MTTTDKDEKTEKADEKPTTDIGHEVHPLVKEYQEKMQLSVQYADSYFDAAVRLYALWRGKLPDALDGTFSKIMLNAANASVQDRLPKYMANLFSTREIIKLQADDPLSEFYAEDAQTWLVDLMMNPNKINLQADIMPTLQACAVMGTGYRMPCVAFEDDQDGNKHPVISSKDIDYFQILPAPEGGLVNPLHYSDSSAIPYFFFIDWMTDDQIESMAKYSGFKKDEWARVKNKAHETDTALDHAMYERWSVIGGVSYGDDKQHYRSKLQDIEGKSGRRRVTHWFGRTFWRIIVQDYYLVYDGPAPLGDGILPLAKYVVTPDFKNWFGISGLEMAEDIIIARIMNLNYRLDHLARVMFPTKWIREDIAGGKPESEFNDRPYAVHFFGERTDIRQAVFYDRAPEITNQTFIEDDRMMLYIQEVLGLPNYSKGMSGEGTLANETASGILSLIKQAQGRMGMESMQLEYTGLSQEARLLLEMAKRFITKPSKVRRQMAEDGFGWTTIAPEALSGNFTVITQGTRYIEQRESEFQKLIAMYPLWNNNPAYDQTELHKQINQVAGVLPDPAKAMVPPQPMPQPQDMTGSLPGVGGMASPQDMGNRNRSVQNRNTVQPGTGNLVPATMQP